MPDGHDWQMKNGATGLTAGALLMSIDRLIGAPRSQTLLLTGDPVRDGAEGSVGYCSPHHKTATGSHRNDSWLDGFSDFNSKTQSFSRMSRCGREPKCCQSCAKGHYSQ